ncbi:MAG: AAA family ATPase, partial [Chloroflexi bacterium]|nr:AAA family ATPase [Chloroflexota bacterium]
STLLSHFRQTTRKKVVVLAPTGVAALNVGGQTIHSFFGFRPNVTLERVKRVRPHGGEEDIYKKLDAIVIDEISMVRADLLDCVDKFMRLNGPTARTPFGGVQMVFIGDLYQLPPVVASPERAVFQSLYQTPYFFGARVFGSFHMEFVELEKVYRQRDEQFISLLNSIRNRTIDDQGLALLNRRHVPGFEPPRGELYVHLTTTNDLAEQVNSRRLAELRSRACLFKADIAGDFGREYLPTAVELQVKPGAQVMMLNNDAEGRWVNGTIGEIASIDEEARGRQAIVVDLAEGERVEVLPYTWKIYNYFVEDGQLQSEAVGKFTQYPLMLAWAVTIHKAQGKTFEKVVIDFGRGTFAHGQAYVALSRCTSLEGMVLARPLLKQHILMDYNVVKFLTRYQYRMAEESCPLDARVETIRRAIEKKSSLQITYLKPNDEKSRRVIRPTVIGEMEYQGQTYLGVRAFCAERGEERTFRVDRILEIAEAQTVGA